MSYETTVRILCEVLDEQVRARAKHGVQVLPDGIEPDALTARMERLSRRITDNKTSDGAVTWADIAYEEWCELRNAKTPAERRMEAIQLAQVLVSWVEDMDKRESARSTPPV